MHQLRAYIGNGRIVKVVGKGNIKVMLRLYFHLLSRRIICL
jgi:hypothetical protein